MVGVSDNCFGTLAQPQDHYEPHICPSMNKRCTILDHHGAPPGQWRTPPIRPVPTTKPVFHSKWGFHNTILSESWIYAVLLAYRVAHGVLLYYLLESLAIIG